ncbi:MAG: ABC transporter permease subunit [Dysgonamonadaceae bacterium]|jgi:phosphate transport system permease protein|nr:ABC transporter permease subunit [Dysgonamonadaceae bacterium]
MKDKTFKILLFLSAISILLLSGGMLYSLIAESLPVFGHLGYLVSGEWFSYIGYTLLIAVLALAIAAPFSISLLLIYAEYCSGKMIASTLAFVMDLFAYIPSVVWGVWAYYSLRPVFGNDILLVSIVLAAMIIPYSVYICVNYIPLVPRSIKEGAYCLGATRLEVLGTICFPFMTKGLIAAGFLSLGKILGETMVVTILFGKTITSVIFNRFGTNNDLESGALFALSLFLILIIVAVNVAARYMFKKHWHE